MSRHLGHALPLLMLVCLASSPAAHAGGGPLGIDHPVRYDDSGIWKRSNQTALIGTLVVGEIGLGLWEGGESRLGRTDWQAIDASLLSAVSTETLKRVFRRERPMNTNDPNQWFKRSQDKSFPSGEVSAVAAIVTPFVLEYGQDHPGVYLLEALPVYDAVARVKVHGHWQSDVLAGFAIGTAVGWYAHGRPSSFTLSVLPDGVRVGYRASW